MLDTLGTLVVRATEGEDSDDSLTDSFVDAIISLKGPGLVVLPKGCLPDGRYQPLSQAIFRINDKGEALILSRHSRQEYVFGKAEHRDNTIIITIPITD